MSRRVAEDTKRPIEDVDTTPEIPAGWRKPDSGELGIHERGICGVYRKTYIISTISTSHCIPRRNMGIR